MVPGKNCGLSLDLIHGQTRQIKSKLKNNLKIDQCVLIRPMSSSSYQSIDYRVPRSLEFALVTPSATYRKLLRPLGGHGATESDLKLGLSEQESVKIAEEKMKETQGLQGLIINTL